MHDQRSTAATGGLRRWQAEALDLWLAGGNRGIAEVATGGGKTRFALACASALQSSSPTLVLVPTTALADQWAVAIAEDSGVELADIGMLTSRSTARDIRSFNVAVINTARNLNFDLWRGTRPFLVVDECHRAGSAENAKALHGDWAATLGLSATPTRQYDDGLEEIIVPALGPIFYRYTLQDAATDGVLSRFELVNVRVELLEEEGEEWSHLSRRIAALAGQRSDQEAAVFALLRRRANVSAQSYARIPMAVHLVEQNVGARQIVFHESIDRAGSIFDMLKARGHSATVYHSGLGPHLRRENLRLFRQGIYDTLVTCRALDEGVNVPEAQVAVIAAASASERQRIQRLGRVLRPAANKDTAQIYTIYATDLEEKRLTLESAALDGVAQVRWMNAGVG